MRQACAPKDLLGQPLNSLLEAQERSVDSSRRVGLCGVLAFGIVFVWALHRICRRKVSAKFRSLCEKRA